MPGTSSLPVLTLDADGNAITVWEQSDPSTAYAGLWSRRRVGGQWQTPIRVTADPKLASEIVTAGDATRAYAAWLQSFNTERRIVATSADASGTWTTLETLRTSTWQQGVVLQPRIAVGGGHAAVVWGYQDSATQRFSIEVRHRPDGGAWAAQAPLAATGIALASYSRPFYDVAFDDAGALVVTWVEKLADRTEIWGRRGDPTDGSLSITWQPAQRVATIVGDPNQIGVRELWSGTHAGRSYAAWLAVAADGSMSIAASHLRPDGSWDAEQATQQIRSTHYAAPRLAAGTSGHKVVMWREPLATSSRIVARTYDPDAGWSGDQIVADNLKAPYFGCIDLDAYYFDVAIDPAGNAIAVWEERLDTQVQGRSVMAVWSSQRVGTGWQAPVRIDGDGGQALAPHAALSANALGIGLFTLQRADGNTTLSVNELGPAE